VIQKSSSGYKGYQTFKIKVCSNGNCKEMLVQAFVRTFENVLLARKDLKRGEVMGSTEKIFDSFLIEKIETTFLRDDFVSDARAILGKRVRKLIKKGEVIFESYFEDLPLVKAGEKVRVIAKVGNVKVETFGIAKADGKLNDFIRILNPASGKLFDARIVNRGVVEVEIEN
jgi:flagella basal body P-ring formation protein FlgA